MITKSNSMHFTTVLMISAPMLLLAETASAQLPANARIDRDIEYANPDGRSLLLDVFRPAKSSQPIPVVVFVHGGGWKNGSRKSGEKNAAWLVDEGFAIVSIEYRLTDVAKWPAQINDCYEAVRWVRRNLKKYNFDGDSIGVWGTSAGGHLATLMGTRPYPKDEAVSSKVQAVCDWFGPTDLLTMPPNTVGNDRTEEDVAKSNGAKLLGITVKDAPDLANDASGLHHVSTDASPFLIMHGSEDPGVPIVQSERLHQKLIAAGVPSTLHIVEGAGHGGKLFQSAKSRSAVLAFFTRHLMKNWSQGSGPTGNFQAPNGSEFDWQVGASVNADRNIRWRKPLPETGQSTVVVWGKRLFFTTMKEVQTDSELGSDIVAWCCNADTGDTLWTRPIPAKHPLRLSGCFSDSSAPPAVTDGQRVCFFNASGRITCFDFDGNELWTNEQMPVGRSQPFLQDGNVVFTRQKYMPVAGHFTHEHKKAPPSQWTNLQALNLATGEEAWATTCGVNMGCGPLPVTLKDGRNVIFVGRGGGHSPPEKPEGVSMVDASNGATIWTLPLDGYMSTQQFFVYGSSVLILHKDQHLWVDVETGKISRQISILKDVVVHSANSPGKKITETIANSGKRNIIQQSNLLVGGYHYFRSYQRPYIGRVDVISGTVEYLQVPIQARLVESGMEFLWNENNLSQPIPKNKKDRPFSVGTKISYVAFDLNDVTNSRGLKVMGDVRSQANGWGHHASQIPTATGNSIYFPIMSGMVYRLSRNKEHFSLNAGTDISLLGPMNKTWTRSSLSFANGSIYAHTIKELICIGD